MTTISCKYFQIRSALTGYVMDVEDGSTEEGARVVMWEQKEDDNDNQLFFEELITGTIRSVLNDFCLTVNGSAKLKPYKPGAWDQRWRIVGNRIENLHEEGEVLDIRDASTELGARIIKWGFAGSENQQWTIETNLTRELPAITPYMMIYSRMNNLVLDVANGDTHAGAKVVTFLRKPIHCENQIFYYEPMSKTIRSMLNDYTLDLDDGTLVLNPWDPKRANYQQWAIDGDKIVRIDKPYKCLDIAEGNPDPGARVACWNDNDGDNQKWSVSIMPQKKSCFFIRSKMTDLVIDVEGGDFMPGATLCMWKEKDHGYSNQLFYEDRQSGTIRTKMNGFCLDVNESNRACVNPYEPGRLEQKWHMDKDTIRNTETGHAIDITDFNRDPGAELCVWDFNAAENQLFEIDIVMNGHPEYDPEDPCIRPERDIDLEEASDSGDSGEEEYKQWRRRERARRRRRREAGKPGRRILWKYDGDSD